MYLQVESRSTFWEYGVTIEVRMNLIVEKLRKERRKTQMEAKQKRYIHDGN